MQRTHQKLFLSKTIVNRHKLEHQEQVLREKDQRKNYEIFNIYHGCPYQRKKDQEFLTK